MNDDSHCFKVYDNNCYANAVAAITNSELKCHCEGCLSSSGVKNGSAENSC